MATGPFLTPSRRVSPPTDRSESLQSSTASSAPPTKNAPRAPAPGLFDTGRSEAQSGDQPGSSFDVAFDGIDPYPGRKTPLDGLIERARRKLLNAGRKR